MARLEIFLKYASNILKFKNFPNHGEAREPFKNIFRILIKKWVYGGHGEQETEGTDSGLLRAISWTAIFYNIKLDSSYKLSCFLKEEYNMNQTNKIILLPNLSNLIKCRLILFESWELFVRAEWHPKGLYYSITTFRVIKS